MPALHSPSNPDNFNLETAPTKTPDYRHGVDSRRSFIPMAFQVTSPLDTSRALLPHALVMHVNPATLSESNTKKKETIQTRGGFVEQHWGDELTDLSADGVTGAFLNIYTGLSSVVRQQTIAWDRYRDLYDLYKSNGSVFDPFGNIVLQGRIRLMYDRGTYLGYFRTFSVEETDDTPFIFKISWTFKVQKTLLSIPYSGSQTISSPKFQGQNMQSPQATTSLQYTSNNTTSPTNLGLAGSEDSGSVPNGRVGII